MSFEKEKFLNDCLEIKRQLVQYLRNPIAEIGQLPNWSWPQLILTHSFLSAICGALAGLIEKKLSLAIIGGFIFSPLLTTITLGVSSAFFYYCFQIFAGRTVSVRKLFAVIMFAHIPQLILQIVTSYVPPVTLVGMAFTAFLLLVGFVKNFQLDRKLTIRMIASLYAVFVLVWFWNQATSSKFEKNWNSEKIVAPEVHLGK